MIIYEFITTASNAKYKTETIKDYIAAYGFEHAKRHIINRLNNAGWKVESIEGHQVRVEDIRDKCDHITD